MSRQLHRIFFLLCSLLCLRASEAAAQPELWSTTFSRIVVTDTATGATLKEFVAPAGICVGTGDMSADRRSYFVPILQGALNARAIARIDTTTQQIAEVIPISTSIILPASCGSIAVSPSDRWWHLWFLRVTGALATFYVRTVDAITRSVSERGNVGPPRLSIAFAPNGLRRYELQYYGGSRPLLIAYPDGSNSLLWQFQVMSVGSTAQVVAGADDVYVADILGPDVTLIRYNAASGAELARIQVPTTVPMTLKFLAYYSDRVFVSAAGEDRQMLASFDEFTLAAGPAITINEVEKARDLHFDHDANVGYWQRQQCVSSVCTDYLQSFAPDTLTLGPLRETASPIGGGRLAEVRRPGRPTLVDASSTGGQVTIAWLPNASGGAPTTFEIWGARRGELPTRVAVVSRATRSWASPVVPPGSYTIDVGPRNAIGAGPPARVEISVDDPSLPQPPTNLVAGSNDGSVKVTWAPAASSAAPASYAIEAAAVGSTNFAAIGHASLPRLFVTGAPAGTWQLRVRAVTSGGSSAPSNPVTVTTSTCTAPPGAPSALAALVTENIVTVEWQPPETDDSLQYIVEVGSNAGLADLARVPITSATASFEIAAPAGVYVARVRTRNRCGESAASNEIVVRVP